jgi:uncharacterized protein (TIGR03083 family)
MARDRAARPPDQAQIEAEVAIGVPADPAELTEYATRHIRACAVRFRQTDPDTPVWTFGPPPTAAFWIRRAAMEETVHFRDAEDTEGRVSPVPVEVAVDGIDELAHVLIPAWLSWGQPRPGRSLRIETSDSKRSWLLQGSEAQTEPAVMSGTAGDVFLALWGRNVAVKGDTEARHDWAALLAVM